MIALSLHPAVGAPPVPPAGNRRGSFAATPEGHRGASGAAGASGGSGKQNRSGAGGKKSSGDLLPGLYVGETSDTPSPVAGDPAPKNSSAYSVNPNLIANVRPPRLPARTMQAESQNKLSEEERAVFGNRKFYSLSLNMPNLNSAGGSWIIRFAALKADSALASPSSRAASSGGPSSGTPSSGELSAPSATRKVDPAYPLELMRQNVGGTVILYAVIHADGTVDGVRVLRSIDDRLDQYASEAIVKWQFQPATKNGAPVDVEATFWIPFRPARVGSNF
jgi:TonB family protein